MPTPRSRSLLFAGVLLGTSALAGTGLAAAGDDAPEINDTIETSVLPTSTTDDVVRGRSADHVPTEEDTTAEEDTSADDATTDETTTADATTGETETSDAGDVTGEADDNHGAEVSAVARQHDGGPGHGDEVSAIARQNHGQERAEEVRQNDDEDVDESTVNETETDDAESDDAESDEQGPASEQGQARGASDEHRG